MCSTWGHRSTKVFHIFQRHLDSFLLLCWMSTNVCIQIHLSCAAVFLFFLPRAFFPFDCHCIPCMQARVATVRMNTTASTTTVQQKHLAGATAYVVVAFILFSSAYFSTWLMLWTAKHNTRLFWYLCLDKSPNAGATSPNNKRQQQRNSKATQYQNARIKEN